jgi:hypothetical protein
LSPPSAWCRIRWLPARLAVCRLERESDAGAPPPIAAGEFLSVTHAPGEISVVCEERFAPPGARVEGGWAALRLEGPIPFEATGVLASLAAPLAAAAVGIFAVSTYDTDYVLVKEADASRAQAALEAAGFTFRSEKPASSESGPAARASS